jgi:hypothetical protein
MPVTDAHDVDDPARSAAPEEAVIRGAVEQRAYSRPRAFRVGSAARLVRGGLYGKGSDGYTGYYMEA